MTLHSYREAHTQKMESGYKRRKYTAVTIKAESGQNEKKKLNSNNYFAESKKDDKKNTTTTI